MSTVPARSDRGVTSCPQADDLAQQVYRATWKFMQSDPGLAQRMRGAAITVGASLAETIRAGSDRSVHTVLQSAAAALRELSYYLHFARRAGLLGDADVRRLSALSTDVERQVQTLRDERREG